MNRVIRPEHPEAYPIVKGEVSSLCISDLTATQRSELWLYIQAHHPDKAKELKILHEDKEFQSLKKTFGAKQYLEATYFPEELKLSLDEYMLPPVK